MSDTSSKNIVLAHITGAHGIKGDVTLKIHAQEPQSLLRHTFGSIKILSVRQGPKGKHVARIEGLNDRNDAEALKGTELSIPRAVAPKEDNEFYLSDLIGLEARQNGKIVGRVKGVNDFGAGELLDVALQTGREVFVPLREPFVLETNIEGGFVEIDQYEVFL